MIDHHIHLVSDYKLKFSLTNKELSCRLDKYSLSGAVVFPCPHVLFKNKNPYEEVNKNILLVCKDDKRFIPFMMVHPTYDDLEYIIQTSSLFKGFKIYPRGNKMEFSYKHIKYSKIMDFLAKSGKPTLFHTGCREEERISSISWFAEKSKSPIVFSHAGDLIEEDLKIASQYDNIFIDISPLATMIKNNFFVSEERRSKNLKKLTIENILFYLINLFGKERIIWGSDTPWCDHLTKNGYLKEIEVMYKMQEMGLNRSFL